MGPTQSKKPREELKSTEVIEKYLARRQQEAYVAIPDWDPLLSLLSTLPVPTDAASFEIVLSELVYLNQSLSAKAFKSLSPLSPSSNLPSSSSSFPENEAKSIETTTSPPSLTSPPSDVASPSPEPVEKKDRFPTLKKFIESELNAEEQKEFFEITLPFILKLAPLIQDEKLFPVQVSPGGFRRCTALPRMYHQQEQSVSLSKLQAAILLANAFLCLFPEDWRYHPAFAEFPDFNFRPLFAGVRAPQEAAKLRCFFHYFVRIHEATNNLANTDCLTALICFQRRVLMQSPDWSEIQLPLRDVEIRETGLIEDVQDALQVDFANRFIGGGVLNGGCVQEEIRFSIEPELLVLCGLAEAMQPNEALLAWGTERYSAYVGYMFGLRYGGDYRQSLSEPMTALACIDACDYRGSGLLSQFAPATASRELLKAFVAFQAPDPPLRCSLDSSSLAASSSSSLDSSSSSSSSSFSSASSSSQSSCSSTSQASVESLRRKVSTGHWGCGAFLGDKQHKVCLQWLAASATGRDMIFFSFGEKFDFTPKLQKLVLACREKQITVGSLWKMLVCYGALVDKQNQQAIKRGKAPGEFERTGVFDFLFEELGIRYDVLTNLDIPK